MNIQQRFSVIIRTWFHAQVQGINKMEPATQRFHNSLFGRPNQGRDFIFLASKLKFSFVKSSMKRVIAPK
jgi:hypothetical protein